MLGALITGATELATAAAGEDGGANWRGASKVKRDEGAGEFGELFGDSDGGLACARAVVEMTDAPATAKETRS